MSEYQYYEFLAIDRPLTSEEREALRDLSTRADITPVSFTNEYNWGDFKGDPDDLMKRFFDAHVYVANWMAAIFKVRLPIEVLSKETVEAFVAPYFLDFQTTKAHWIITWSLEESEDYDRFGMEDGRGWMARLVPVRDELLRGDLRSLYIGWLAGVSEEILDDDQLEPLPISGLANLTAAQQALAEFLEIDQDLLVGSGMGNPNKQYKEMSQHEMDEWISTLPQDEVNAILKQLLDGKGQQAERVLKNRFAAWQRSMMDVEADTALRTVRELRNNTKEAEKIRLEKQKRDKEKREIQRHKERAVYLKKLSRDFPKVWKSVQKTLERGSGLAYDEACHKLVDLSEAYSLHANQKRFQKDLKKFMADNLRSKALIQRLVKAGIWH